MPERKQFGFWATRRAIRAAQSPESAVAASELLSKRDQAITQAVTDYWRKVTGKDNSSSPFDETKLTRIFHGNNCVTTGNNTIVVRVPRGPFGLRGETTVMLSRTKASEGPNISVEIYPLKGSSDSLAAHSARGIKEVNRAVRKMR